MYALYLNPMTGNCETAVCIAVADTAPALENFLVEERCEPYINEGPDFFNKGRIKNYHKSFNKGGPLEMFNPPEISYCEPSGIIEVPSMEDLHMNHADRLAEDVATWLRCYGQALHL